MDDEVQRFFGFSDPFGRIDDPADLFRPASRVGQLSGMVNDVLVGPVVTSVRGGRGVGKTSFAALLAAEFRSRKLTVVPLGSTSQSPLKVQRQIGEALGVEAAATMKPDHLLQLLQAKEGMERIVLLFDDAEALPVTVFRYLQLLMGLFRFGPSQLSIILIGGFGQWANLELPDLEPIRSATTSFNMLFSLREDEAAAYLEHKFALAGCPLREVMSRSAASELLAQAGGNPAQIDRLTEQALQYAFDNQRRRITASLLRRTLPDDDAVAQPPRRLVGRTALAGAVMAALAAALFVWRDDIGETLRGYAGGRAAASSTPGAAAPPATAVTAIDPLPAPLSEAPPAPGPADASPSRGPSLPEPAPVVASALTEHETASPAAPPSAAPWEQPAMGLPSSASGDNAPPPEAPSLPPAAPDKTEVATSQPAAAEPAAAEPSPPMASPESVAPMASAEPVAPVTSPALPSQEATAALQAAPERANDQQPAAPLRTPLEPMLAGPSAPPSSRRGGPGLVLVAQGRDDLRTLYARVYRGMTPPPLPSVLAANPAPVRPGTLLIFPEPPDGWTATRGRSP